MIDYFFKIIFLFVLIIHSVLSFPIAINQLVIVNASSSVVIRFRGYDQVDPYLTINLLNLPVTGNIYQLSQVFSNYGYQPAAGNLITTSNTIVVGSSNRIVYKRPNQDYATNKLWDILQFTIISSTGVSYPGQITLVPPTGLLVGSDFLLSNEEWTIIGNKNNDNENIQQNIPQKTIWENKNRGLLLSNYIISSDNLINLNNNKIDINLWYFLAPKKFLGNFGIAYGGYLSFVLSSFSGNFKNLNSDSVS